MIGQSVQIGERMRIDRLGLTERHRGPLRAANHAAGLVNEGQLPHTDVKVMPSFVARDSL